MGEFVRVEVEDGVATIRVDRPKMNALNAQVQEEIRAAATECSEREDVKAVVVWGGERVFAAGADIKEMADMSYTDMVRRSGALQSSFSAVARIPKPVVAAVNGYALGGGCELALCADVRVAAEDAVLGQPEILLGIIPGAGGTQRLSRLVGPSKAKDLIFTGRFVKAQEALTIGLVDRVVPADRVYAEAVAWGSGITPFKSMIEDLLQVKQDTRPMTLYWGMRYAEQLFWTDELAQIQEAFPNFRLHPVVSQPLPEWSLCRGRVTDCLSVHQFHDNAGFYLCGNQAMIDQVTAFLTEKQVLAENIHFEKFF